MEETVEVTVETVEVTVVDGETVETVETVEETVETVEETVEETVGRFRDVGGETATVETVGDGETVGETVTVGRGEEGEHLLRGCRTTG